MTTEIDGVGPGACLRSLIEAGSRSARAPRRAREPASRARRRRHPPAQRRAVVLIQLVDQPLELRDPRRLALELALERLAERVELGLSVAIHLVRGRG